MALNEQDVIVKLTEHENRIKVSERRIADLESQQKQIQELTMSVRELAISVKNLTDEQKAQGERIKAIETEPADKWKHISKTLITAIVSALVGAGVTALVSIL